MTTSDARAGERLLEQLAEDVRRQQGPGHPTTAMLAAYRAGDLAPEEVDGVQEHLAVCRPCVRSLAELRGFQEAMEDVEGADDARTEASWRALRARLAPELAAAERAPEGRGRRTSPATVSRFRRLTTSPRMVAALAAALVACLVVAPLWIARHSAGPAALGLYLPGGREVTRGPGEAGGPLVVDLGTRPVLLVLPLPPGLAFPAYRIDILTRGGEARLGVGAVPGAVADSAGTGEEAPRYLTIALPPRRLTPGEYRLRIVGLRRGHGEVIAEQPLRVTGR